MTQERPILGEIDPAVLYDGPTVDHIFQINPSTRWRWCRAGRLRACYPGGPGGRPRFRGAELLRLIEPGSESIA